MQGRNESCASRPTKFGLVRIGESALNHAGGLAMSPRFTPKQCRRDHAAGGGGGVEDVVGAMTRGGASLQHARAHNPRDAIIRAVSFLRKTR